jgi:glutamate 5-kinase
MHRLQDECLAVRSFVLFDNLVETMKRNISSVIVVKLGTGVLRSQNDGLNRGVFVSVLKQIAQLRAQRIGVVVVSSGAIHSARVSIARHTSTRRLKELSEPALASVGQPLLMQEWIAAGFSLTPPLFVAQLLPTNASISNRHEWHNSAQVIFDCLKHGVVPIINYNDPLSFAAIELLLKQANDNDKLTADFAPHIGAKAVLFLTEAGGVHDGHPANGGTRLYQEIDWRNPPFLEEGGASHGRGEMKAKVVFAIECRKRGIKRVTITGLTHDVILRFGRGEYVSTMVGNRNVLES